MTTLKKLTYRVWRILEGGDIPDDSRFRYDEIKDHIRASVFTALKSNYFEGRNDEDGYKYGNDSVTVDSIVTTKHDDSMGIAYIDVEEASIAVPAVNRMLSITDLNPYSRGSKMYIPVRSEERFTGQLQPPIPGTILYERTGGKVYFYNEIIKAGCEVRLRQKYVVKDEDDSPLNLPLEYEAQIVDTVTRLLDREIRMRDISNDGSPNIVNRV